MTYFIFSFSSPHCDCRHVRAGAMAQACSQWCLHGASPAIAPAPQDPLIALVLYNHPVCTRPESRVQQRVLRLEDDNVNERHIGSVALHDVIVNMLTKAWLDSSVNHVICAWTWSCYLPCWPFASGCMVCGSKRKAQTCGVDCCRIYYTSTPNGSATSMRRCTWDST